MLEQWSDEVCLARLSDDPQFTEDLAAVEQSCGRPGHSAVLDFAAVRFLNSSNIARLLRLRKRTSGANSKILLCNLRDPVWGLFLTTGIDGLFSYSDNVATALATIQMNAGG